LLKFGYILQNISFQPVSNLAVECALNHADIGVSGRVLMFNLHSYNQLPNFNINPNSNI